MVADACARFAARTPLHVGLAESWQRQWLAGFDSHVILHLNAVSTASIGQANVSVPLPAKSRPTTSPVPSLMLADPLSPWSENIVPPRPSTMIPPRNQHGPGAYGIVPATAATAATIRGCSSGGRPSVVTV